jgi:hypothetical protein
VVVTVGATVTFEVALTVPTLLSVTVSAFCTLQESLEVWPVVMDAGSAMKNRILTAGLAAVVMRTRALP